MEPGACYFCLRPLGRRVEWHHPVPKSRGGRSTVPVHPICHRAIHAAIDNKSLARDFSSGDALRAHPGLVPFLRWIENKDPDFHVSTHRRQGR